jgi:hypothetical protein
MDSGQTQAVAPTGCCAHCGRAFDDHGGIVRGTLLCPEPAAGRAVFPRRSMFQRVFQFLSGWQ